MTGYDASPAREDFHGFHLSPQQELLLRGAVPERALRWAAAVGGGARVCGSEALVGGTTSAVHALTVAGGDGRLHELVLPRFVRAGRLAEEPDVAEREAAALTLLAGRGLPTPRLVAVDPDGTVVGVAAVLMTRCPAVSSGTRRRWRGSCAASPSRCRSSTRHRFPGPRCCPAISHIRSSCAARRCGRSRPGVWWRAFELLDGPPPSAERAVIHRDYHPGNVLWPDGRVSGVIDWVNASVGCPWADVGHCRVNIASELGQPATERFLELYRAGAGRGDDYHPYWDIARGRRRAR